MFTGKNSMGKLINKNKLICFSKETKLIKDVFAKGLQIMNLLLFIMINIAKEKKRKFTGNIIIYIYI